MVENCDTLFSHNVDFEFVSIGTQWIATDTNYRRFRLMKRKGGEPVDD